MATSKCFSKISIKQFEKIERQAAAIAKEAGRTEPRNGDYAEVVRGLLEAAEVKLAELKMEAMPVEPVQEAPPAPKVELGEEVKAAKQRLKEAKGDVTKLSDADLPIILGEFQRLNNNDGVAKTAAEMQKRGMESPVVAEAVAEAPPAQEAPAEEQKILTDRERAAEAWNAVADEFGPMSDFPRFESLSKKDQRAFVEFGEDNWTRQDVLALATKYDSESDAKFGKDGRASDPYTAEELLNDLKAFMRADIPGRKLLVVDSVADLLNNPDKRVQQVAAALALEGAYGVATDGRAFLIANRINKGTGRAKFMHEVGSHLGLENLLPKAVYNRLVNQIKQWADSDQDTDEVTLANRALLRVENAGTPDADRDAELLAYFIEEAVQGGIDPTAEAKASGPLREWFRTLWAAFKVAVRKLGFKPESLQAVDVVNMAYGAARLEIAGTWHGTAASFRKFNHKFMGTGEGAQAFGWGTYLAQRTGIAKGYWSADVRRKTRKGVGVTFDGKPLAQVLTDLWNDKSPEAQAIGQAVATVYEQVDKNSPVPVFDAITELNSALGDKSLSAADRKLIGAASQLFNDVKFVRRFTESDPVSPDGSLMRVDTSVDERDMLDWDRPLSEQESVISKLGMYLPNDLREAVEEEANADLGEMTGEELYKALQFLEDRDGRVSDLFEVDYYNKNLANAGPKKIVSTYLDQQIGIQGIRFLDANSRGADPKVVVVNGKSYTRDDLVSMKNDTRGVGPYSATLRSVLRNGVEATKKELQERVNETFLMFAETEQQSAARYGVQVDTADVQRRARAEADNTYQGKQLAWLKGQDITVKTEPITRTRNLVIFNDKNIFRIGSEAAADRERMRFGRDPRFEGLPNKNDPVVDSKGTKSSKTNIDRAIRLMDRAAKAKDPEQAAALRAEAQRLMEGAARGIAKGDGRMRFGKDLPAAPNASVVQRNIAKLPKQMQQPARNTVAGIGDVVNKVLDRVVFTSDLINRAVKSGITSAQTFSRLLAERATKARELEREVEKIADMYSDVEEKDKGDGPRSLNQFLFESTRQGKWGYGKFADADMKAWFDELGPNSQKLAKAIFAHGEKILEQKKQAVIKYTNSEYDALIKAAKDSGDTKLEAELTTDKANSLKKFERLFKIREGKPYAPIKRMGNHVVVAKSQAYRDAEKAKDAATLRKLESDPDHYHVSFTDTKAEARRLADRLREQGFYGQDEAAVTHFERAADENELFGGESTFSALTKLRGKVDETGSAQLQRIVTDMWLTALAEDSARKSEIRRRGVSGEVDMLRSFAAQGRADAQFIASVQYNPQTQDAIQAMRDEVKGGDRDRKSEIYNELMERYAKSLDVVHTPVVDKLTRMSSVYFLATSPMYYLQNLTQPWMMSVPAMAGKHDYTAVSKALWDAYAELGPVMKSVKLFQQLGRGWDFTQVPADVRTAIQELVNRGRIDIGLDTELGEFRIDGSGAFADGWNKVDKGMRMLVQKGEAINRLSTAIAAYRLELKRTGSKEAALDYADKILIDTHFDYGRFNAPKYFNTSVGRVALQFRKFQLGQLTWYAKMIKEAGFNPQERAAAIKSLTFALGHTALLAGAMGLPGYAAIAWVLGAVLGDEDEKYDLTYKLRQAIGNEQMANLIMRGAPTLAGADISGRVGAGTMLSIMPFSNADLSTPQGQMQAFGTLIGGATLGMTTRVADGLGLMLSGEWMRGAETVLPKGLGDAIRGARQASEGMTRRNGDVILPADEINAVETFMQMMGMPTVDTSVTYERRNRAYDMDKQFRERSTKLKNQYAKAARERDQRTMRETQDAWRKLQEARKRNGYQVQPLSQLLKAPQEQAKREANTVGGVQFNRSNQGFAERQASF